MLKWKRQKFLTKKERKSVFMLIFAFIVFVVVYWGILVSGFFSNCVFHWPIRWDIGTCWGEQKAPATKTATDAAGYFIP